MTAPDQRYDVIAADPAWSFSSTAGGGNQRHVERQYKTMSIAEIKALDPFISMHAKPICRLFLWVVDSQMEAGLEVMRAWGFKPVKTAFTWVKLTSKEVTGKDLENAKAAGSELHFSPRYGYRRFAFGPGRTTRNGSEACLLGARGPMPVADQSQRQVIAAPRRRHSQKPEEFFERVEKMYPKARRLELFARDRRAGWDAWGDEL